MKTTVCLLLVTISCCFNLAASNCGKKCSSVCRQSQLNDVTCLQKAMYRNMPATVGAMANVLCVYDMFKVSENKVEIVRAIRNLQETAGCNLANLLGSGATYEALSLDVNGFLQYLLRCIHDLLINLNIGDYTIPQCGPVKPLLTKVHKILLLYSVPSFNGQSQTTIPIDRVSRLLALIQIRAPELFQPLLEVLVGSSALVRELVLSLSRLTGEVIKTVGDMGKRLDKITPMVTDVTGSRIKSIGGTAGSVMGSQGLLSGVTGLLPSALNSVTDLVGNTIGTVTRSVEGLLGEQDGGLLKTATELIGNLADSKTGILGSVGGVLGGVPLGIVTGFVPKLLDGAGGNSPLGIVTNALPNLLGGVLGTSGSGSNNGPTKIMPNPLWGSGNYDSATIPASGSVTGSLGGNVGHSASGQLGFDLGRPILNTGYPGGSMMENGGGNDVGGSISESGVSRATDTSAYGFTSISLK
ncbi:uncharacterized protein LOC143964336 [Lithobates pipiens]